MPQFEIMDKIRCASQHNVKPGNPEASKVPMGQEACEEQWGHEASKGQWSWCGPRELNPMAI